MNRSQFDLAVGAFVALGILALLFLAMKVGNLTGFDTGTAYLIEARFDNIGGLKVRAPVKAPVWSSGGSNPSALTVKPMRPSLGFEFLRRFVSRKTQLP